MSVYTTEVRFICETLAEYNTSQGYEKVAEIIDKSWDKVFDFDFPIFDEEYRSVLCKKILMHYYTREIGLETVGLWKLKLNTRLNEIMPYYNKVYESTLEKFDIFADADYTKEHVGKDDGRGSDNNSYTDAGTDNKVGKVTDERDIENSSTNYNLFSDTPQGALTGVNTETYLTDARKITDNSNTNDDNVRNYNENNKNERSGKTNRSHEFSNTNEYLEHIVGKTPGKSYSKMLSEYRETLLNVDMMVINELNNLFMLVW